MQVHDKRAPKGFSLVDLLSVVALVAVLAVVAVPQLTGFTSNYGLVSAADELAAELNAARTMAVSRGATYTINFQLNDSTYQVVDVSDPDNPTRVLKTLGDNLKIESAPNPPITFSSRGVARGGTIVLSSTNGRRIVVQVESSGRTKVHDMTSTFQTQGQ